MTLITIEVKYDVMTVKMGKLKRSRLVWTAPGVQIYVIGSLDGMLYEQASNLAMNYCQGMHIPASSLRRVSYTSHLKASGTDTQTKRMF